MFLIIQKFLILVKKIIKIQKAQRKIKKEVEKIVVIRALVVEKKEKEGIIMSIDTKKIEEVKEEVRAEVKEEKKR